MSARRLLLLPAAAVLFALTACGATEEPVLGSAAPDSPAAVPTSAAASKAVGAKPAATTKATRGTESAACPSGANLQKLVELPKGQTFGKVQCVKGWAGVAPRGSGGDGVYLFHYKAGTGWKYYGEGSGYDCKDLGLKEPAPFCVSDPETPKKKPATSVKCPSAKTLEALVELPKGQTFGKVQCVKDWAGVAPQGGGGDGVYLFHYKAGTGWKYYGEGSGYDCKDLGLNEPAPFCIS